MTEIVSIQILGRTLKVNCPLEEQASLQQAVVNLNERLQGLKQRHKVISSDQLIIIVALNLCSDLLKSQQRNREQFEILMAKTERLEVYLEQALLKARRPLSSV